MASANLDLVRSMYNDWERGDYSSSEWAHPEIEWVIADGPSPGVWKGPAGLAAGWRDFLDAWENVRHEVDEYRVLDTERVLVLHRFIARGKTSGLELAKTGAMGAGLARVRDGQVTSMILYFNRERALADLGLAPERGSP